MNWYIEKTTSKERRAICDTMLGLFVDAESGRAPCSISSMTLSAIPFSFFISR